MKKKNGLFVKISYNNIGMVQNEDRNKDVHINHDMKQKKYLLCAGVLNKQGGTMIFQASNMDEAQHIINNNPFPASKVYSYEILKGDVIAL